MTKSLEKDIQEPYQELHNRKIWTFVASPSKIDELMTTKTQKTITKKTNLIFMHTTYPNSSTFLVFKKNEKQRINECSRENYAYKPKHGQEQFDIFLSVISSTLTFHVNFDYHRGKVDKRLPLRRSLWV